MEEATKFRKLARQKLKGFWKDVFIVTLIISFVFTMLYLLEYYIQRNDLLYLLVTLFVFIITFPLNYGYIDTLYKIRNMKKYSYLGVFTSAIKNFRKSWSIFANIILKILPLFLIFLLVTFVLAFGATILANTNLSENTFSSFSEVDNTTKLGIASFFIGTIGYLLCVVLFIPKFFLYSLSFFIGITEPNLKSKEIVEKSSILMQGNRKKLFSLFISFVFWAILALIPFSICLNILHLPLIGLSTFLITYSLLIPYIIFTFIEFYEDKNEKQIIEDSQN